MSLILCMSLLTGCGNVAYTFPYDVNSSVSSFNVLAGTGAGRAEPFAADLCVVTEDQTGDGSVDMSQASAAVLFDVKIVSGQPDQGNDGTGGITECVTGYCADSYG